MRLFGTGWRWLRSLGRRRELDSELDEEIRFHLEQQTAKNLCVGMTPDEARRRALVTFGALESAKESARDQFRVALLEDSLRDLRYGWRALRRAPVFTIVATLKTRPRHRRGDQRLQRRQRRAHSAAPLSET